MNIQTATQALETEWEQVQSKGFFGKLRIGEFDSDGFERVKRLLNSLELPNEEFFDKRFVEVVWFIPTFMRWQRDAWFMENKDVQAIDKAIQFFEQRLTTILGLP